MLTYKEGSALGQVNKFLTNYIIDVQLVKGTPLVFLDFAQNFFNTIEKRIEMQYQRLKSQANSVDCNSND
jgi:hypothetical protein